MIAFFRWGIFLALLYFTICEAAGEATMPELQEDGVLRIIIDKRRT